MFVMKYLIDLENQNNMDTPTKDSLANLTTIGGIGLTMADVTSVMTLCVLTTALILNIQRIYTWFKDRK